MNPTESGGATLRALAAKCVQRGWILQWEFNYYVDICWDLENNYAAFFGFGLLFTWLLIASAMK